MRRINNIRLGRRRYTGFVHLARIFTVAAVMASAGALAALAQPDVLIRDCVRDNGSTPTDTPCWNTFHNSPDVWIRINPDGGTIHQQPQAGQTVTVYVRVENIGNSVLEYGEVELHYATAAAGLSNWPAWWVGNAPYGDFIGSVPVDDLGPGDSRIVAIPWGPVPANSNGDHFCLLARFISSEDPMTTPEGLVVRDNTRNNNNIAWKNLSSVYASNNGDRTVPAGRVVVHNGRNDNVTMRLGFDMNQPGEDEELPEELQIRVRLGAELYQSWADGGKQGLTSGIIDNDGDHAIIVTETQAWIDGLEMEPDEEHAVEVEVIYPDEFTDLNVHHWVLSQWEDGDDMAIGGMSYDIYMEPAPEGMGKQATQPDGDLGTKLELSAQPNTGSSAMTLGFTLPADDQVTLAIYDINGRLVRTLLSEHSKAAGSHTVVWNGQSDAGEPVPNGTYFYSLSTKEGVVQKQLKIVR